VNRLLIYIMVFLVGLAPGMGGLAGAQTVQELERSGLDHFGKAFHEAAPRKEHGKAAAEYRLAEEAFQEAIRSKPDWVEPYLHLGRTYFVQKKYRLAAEVYRKALTIAPQRKEVYLQLASALEMAGDYEGAVSVLKDLRAQETDHRSIRILDEFIDRIQSRGKASPKAKEGGK
jgi:cytochrome c-type biogenesis protein CcmH/NrfG